MVDENVNYFESNEIKYLVRERERISKEIAKIKNDIEKIVIVTKDYPSSKKIREVSEEKIEEIINKNRRGRKSSVSSKRIIELAKNSIGISSDIKRESFPLKYLTFSFLWKKKGD